MSKFQNIIQNQNITLIRNQTDNWESSRGLFTSMFDIWNSFYQLQNVSNVCGLFNKLVNYFTFMLFPLNSLARTKSRQNLYLHNIYAANFSCSAPSMSLSDPLHPSNLI